MPFEGVNFCQGWMNGACSDLGLMCEPDTHFNIKRWIPVCVMRNYFRLPINTFNTKYVFTFSGILQSISAGSRQGGDLS